jgi:hypothetical protein
MKHTLVACVLFVLSICVNAQQPRRKATLEQQKMCYDQAQKAAKDLAMGDDWSFEWTSHYNARANVCFVRVNQMRLKLPETTISVMVRDAFENEDVAMYFGVSNSQTNETSVRHCTVQQITCKDHVEFQTLLKKVWQEE